MRGRAALSILLLCAGCGEAKQRFEAFGERRAAADHSDAGSAGGAPTLDCAPPAPDVVHGPALMAIETKTAPGQAILFLGNVETPEIDGATNVKYSYRALDASDRKTPVGDPLVVGPYAIGQDGTFEAPTAESTLPGSANAILPGAPITSQLTLHGTICGVQSFYCGTITGSTTAPVKGPTQGQFGLTLLESADAIPERPRFGCAEGALLQPLE